MKYVSLGVPTTVGELKELLKDYPDEANFGFLNQPMQELFISPDRKSIVFQPLEEHDLILLDSEIQEITRIIENKNKQMKHKKVTEETKQLDAENRMIVIEKIIKERRKNYERWGVQDYTPLEWSAILAEESGEVSKAAVDIHFKNPIQKDMTYDKHHFAVHIDQYEKELIQVAAVAIQALECLMRNRKP